MYFGDNGVPLLQVSELALENELKPKLLETVVLALFSVLSASGICLYAVLSPKVAIELNFILPTCFVVMIFSLIPVFVYFSGKAVEQGYLSPTLLSQSKHKHFPGAAVLAIAIILTFIIFMARYFHTEYTQNGDASIVLANSAGLWVLFLIGISFVLMILLPRLSASTGANRIGRLFSSLLNEKTGLGRYLTFLGNAVSKIDSWLVYVIAPAAGVTQEKTRTRYLLIISYLLPCGILAWYLPALFGFFPVLAAFIISISIARRWAWVESDREITLRNPKYSAEQLRVGVGQDLRDEALLALLSLIIMLPLAMRQAHLFALDINISTWGLFTYQGDSNELITSGIAVTKEISFINWLAFFGTELAKAVPFVDWADIYHIESSPTIRSVGPYSYHVVFIARAIVDLVFLGALLQAITSSFKLSQHKKLFFEGEINVLDPILEKMEFEKLARFSDQNWIFKDEELRRFKHYDRFALSKIRVNKNTSPKMLAVATKLLAMNNILPSSPDEVFIEELSRDGDLSYKNITNAYQDACDFGPIDFDFMKYAIKVLNGKSEFTPFRRLLVTQLSNPENYPRTQALISLFRDIGHGDDSDSVGTVRSRVIPVLLWASREQIFRHWPKQTLENMAQKDPAKEPRENAIAALLTLHNPVIATHVTTHNPKTESA